MLATLNTSNNLMPDNQGKDTFNNYRRHLNFLLKALKNCKPITGNLLIRIIERLDINSNSLLR